MTFAAVIFMVARSGLTNCVILGPLLVDILTNWPDQFYNFIRGGEPRPPRASQFKAKGSQVVRHPSGMSHAVMRWVTEDADVSEKDGRPVRRLYQKVADQIAEQIEAGTYAVGERLPAERELARDFGVSRPTAREAIIALELQGIVEVRIGSGVYVTAQPSTTRAQPDGSAGPFEIMEARRLIEGESAALAATVITDAQLTELEQIVADMEDENRRHVWGEAADRRFHMAIAHATQNSAMAAVVEQLWDMRDSSPLSQRLLKMVRQQGVQPVIDEHRAIVAALRMRDAKHARAAMRKHLARVIEGLLEATEVEEIEKARAQVQAQRSRYAFKGDV
jgi:GntR family transcriptional regulator, hexuronate regulon transcriptional repressor